MNIGKPSPGKFLLRNPRTKELAMTAEAEEKDEEGKETRKWRMEGSWGNTNTNLHTGTAGPGKKKKVNLRTAKIETKESKAFSFLAIGSSGPARLKGRWKEASPHQGLVKKGG